MLFLVKLHTRRATTKEGTACRRLHTTTRNAYCCVHEFTNESTRCTEEKKKSALMAMRTPQREFDVLFFCWYFAGLLERLFNLFSSPFFPTPAPSPSLSCSLSSPLFSVSSLLLPIARSCTSSDHVSLSAPSRCLCDRAFLFLFYWKVVIIFAAVSLPPHSLFPFAFFFAECQRRARSFLTCYCACMYYCWQGSNRKLEEQSRKKE